MSQAQKLYSLLSDGLPHRTDEIVREVYGEGMSLARVGARIYDIKRKYNVDINGWHDKDQPALYWYQLKQNFWSGSGVQQSLLDSTYSKAS